MNSLRTLHMWNELRGSSEVRAFSIRVGASLLLFLAASVAWAQIVSPATERAHCGEKIDRDDVLVLDLEPFEGDVERVQQFIASNVENLKIKSSNPETIRTATRSARKNRMSAMKRSRTEVAKRGCDVVLVVAAWIGDDDALYAHRLPNGQGAIAAGLHYAYARVLMATGDH